MKELLNNIKAGVELIRKGQFAMKYTKKHQTVKSYVRLIQKGEYTFDEVPNLFNLRKVVKAVLDEINTEK